MRGVVRLHSGTSVIPIAALEIRIWCKTDAADFLRASTRVDNNNEVPVMRA